MALTDDSCREKMRHYPEGEAHGPVFGNGSVICREHGKTDAVSIGI